MSHVFQDVLSVIFSSWNQHSPGKLAARFPKVLGQTKEEQNLGVQSIDEWQQRCDPGAIPSSLVFNPEKHANGLSLPNGGGVQPE